jgi:putative ABC transport system permease protein
MEAIWQDLRYSAKMLRKQPAFTMVAVLTLALGIGANTSIFSVINALVLSPPSIVESDRVAAVFRTGRNAILQGYVSYLELQDWQSQIRSFEVITGYKPRGMVLIREGKAERIPGMRVTANFLSFLRVKPLRGRDFQLEEERRGAQPVVMISYAFWQARFGGSDTVLGQKLEMDGKPYTVIGVLPPSFTFPMIAQKVELLATIAGEGGNLGERGAQVLLAAGRLKPGVTMTQAQGEIAAVASNLEQKYPLYNKDITAYLVPADEQIVGPEVRHALWVLLGTVVFILLIACTNVTNLLLVRASVRQKELALRAALGAGRSQVARQMLMESLIISFLSGGLGLIATQWGLSAIQYYGRDQLPRLNEVQIDGRVLMFTLIASVLTALLFSLLPVLKAARPEIHEVLKGGAKSTTGGRNLRLWRDSLVIGEVALGLVLLVGAGLMIRSFENLVNVNPGFNPENVLTARITLTRPVYAQHEERVRFVDQTLERLKALPGVQAAAFVAPMPFSGGNVGSDFRIEGRPRPEPGKEPEANNRSVTAEYFQALGIPLRKGRYFSAADRRGDVGVAIINETLARRYFAGEDPIGVRISHIGANQNEGDPEQWEIVGIVGDVHHSTLVKPATPEIYLPYQQNSWDWGNFFIRSSSDPSSMAKTFTERIQSADRTVLVTGVQPLTQAIADTTAQTRFYTFLFGLFGGSGLLLTLTGIYSVISYTVSQRMREVGIRVALGAKTSDVLKLIIGRGMFLAATGTIIGVVVAATLTSLMQNLLFGLNASDPSTFVLISLLLTSAALPACWIPARRATRADPTIALRSE